MSHPHFDLEVNSALQCTSAQCDHPGECLWDVLDRLDASLFEWVQREQAELQEVEKTLERAAEILQVRLKILIYSHTSCPR